MSFSFLFSEIFHVNENGVDNASCSQTQPCLHIQTAIDLTMDGDVVMVSPGTYVENILIETAITVQGSDSSDPAVIDGSSPSSNAPNAWNESCVVIKTQRGRTSRISATLQDVKVTGGKGTMVIIDGNKDGDFDDVGTGDDISKKVGGGIIVSNANMTGRRLQVVNNGDASTKEGGGVYAAGTGAGVPDNNPNLPPLPGDDERSSIVFEESIFSGNEAIVGNTIMVNGWDPENQFINMDFGNAQFDVAFDSDDDEFDGVSEHWIKGLDNATFDFTGGITGELDAIIMDVWVDPVNGWDEGNAVGDSLNPFLTIDHAMGMIYPTEDNPINIYLIGNTFSAPNITFPIYMTSHVNLIGEGKDITIIDSQSDTTAIIFDDVINTMIKNLSITGVTASNSNDITSATFYGSGVIARDSEAILINVSIDSNHGRSGGGIFISNSEFEFINVSVINNSTLGFDGVGVGGGILIENSNVIIDSSLIAENIGGWGGGLDIRNSNINMLNTSIIDNNATQKGGGAYLFGVIANFYNVTIERDTSNSIGGGLYSWYSTITMENSTVSKNYHGGIDMTYCYNNLDPIFNQYQDAIPDTSLFKNVVFNNNRGEGGHEGGAFKCEYCHVVIEDATFMSNQAKYGGSIFQEYNSTMIVKNTAIIGSYADWGGAVLGAGWAGYAKFINTTISGNFGGWGGAFLLSGGWSPIIINSIIRNNSSWDGVEIALNNTNSPCIFYSNIEGDWGTCGIGNIMSDPLFNDDYTLQEGSSSIDAGISYFEYGDEVILDISGNEYNGCAPDMGAFESSFSSGCETIIGDLTGDGQLNILDVVALVNIVLGYAEPIDSGDLNGDGSLNILDVVALVEIILGG